MSFNAKNIREGYTIMEEVLVDTGADITTLIDNDLKGINYIDTGDERNLSGFSTREPIMAKIIIIPYLCIGDLNLKDVVVGMVKKSDVLRNIVGMDILGHFDLNFVNSKSKLIFTKRTDDYVIQNILLEFKSDVTIGSVEMNETPKRIIEIEDDSDTLKLIE